MTCLFLVTEEDNFSSNFLRIIYVVVNKLEGKKENGGRHMAFVREAGGTWEA